MKGFPMRHSFAAVGCLLGSVLWMLAEEFWRRHDAGEFKGPASQPERAP